MYILYPKIISLILKASDREFTMQEAGFIKVQSKIKAEISWSVLFESNLENYLFRVLLETSRLNYQNMKGTLRFSLLNQKSLTFRSTMNNTIS